ncbi:MAG: hypothetical protein ACOH2L_17900 [Devosia sp.]
MNIFKLIMGELFGLFVDDEFLAVAILAVIALAAAIAHWGDHSWAGAILLLGCLVVVTASLARARVK